MYAHSYLMDVNPLTRLQVRIVRREPRDPSVRVPFHFYATEMQVQINGLNLVYDRDVLRRCLAFFLGPPPAGAPPPPKPAPRPPPPLSATGDSLADDALPEMMFDNSTYMEIEVI